MLSSASGALGSPVLSDSKFVMLVRFLLINAGTAENNNTVCKALNHYRPLCFLLEVIAIYCFIAEVLKPYTLFKCSPLWHLMTTNLACMDHHLFITTHSLSKTVYCINELYNIYAIYVKQ